MKTVSLQSGSSGNCIYVETDDVRLLFDAGICGAAAERRLAALGRDIRSIDALIVSHDHSDHILYAGVYQRKYGIPLYISPGTLEAAEKGQRLGRLKDVTLFPSGGAITFGTVTVETIPTPHDSAEGSAFVVSCKGKRLGILTDLGHVFGELRRTIGHLDAVFIESNYDPEMLRLGPYPAFLKRRIEGEGGHISNFESAELLAGCSRLKWACLAHLSEKNNSPELALRTHREIVGTDLKLCTAYRDRSTGILAV